MEGFTYNGVHCEELGVYYIPDAAGRWEGEPEFEADATDVQGRHGGYFYRSRVKSRSITLDCFYEDVTLAQREAIKRW